MQLKGLDHLVITTAKPQECVAFYEALGFKSRNAIGRLELVAPSFKLNVHIKGKELEPKAQIVQPGSGDFCFEIAGSIEECRANLKAKGLALEVDIVERVGFKGRMQSIYLRDPDGNLVELCSYE